MLCLRGCAASDGSTRPARRWSPSCSASAFVVTLTARVHSPAQRSLAEAHWAVHSQVDVSLDFRKIAAFVYFCVVGGVRCANGCTARVCRARDRSPAPEDLRGRHPQRSGSTGRHRDHARSIISAWASGWCSVRSQRLCARFVRITRGVRAELGPEAAPAGRAVTGGGCGRKQPPSVHVLLFLVGPTVA